jgi:hypothetical protein
MTLMNHNRLRWQRELEWQRWWCEVESRRTGRCYFVGSDQSFHSLHGNHPTTLAQAKKIDPSLEVFAVGTGRPWRSRTDQSIFPQSYEDIPTTDHEVLKLIAMRRNN